MECTLPYLAFHELSMNHPASSSQDAVDGSRPLCISLPLMALKVPAQAHGCTLAYHARRWSWVFSSDRPLSFHQPRLLLWWLLEGPQAT